MVDDKGTEGEMPANAVEKSVIRFKTDPRSRAARTAFITVLDWQWLRVSGHLINTESGEFELERARDLVFIMPPLEKSLNTMKNDFVKKTADLVQLVEEVLAEELSLYGLGIVRAELSRTNPIQVLKFYRKKSATQ